MFQRRYTKIHRKCPVGAFSKCDELHNMAVTNLFSVWLRSNVVLATKIRSCCQIVEMLDSEEKNPSVIKSVLYER